MVSELTEKAEGIYIAGGEWNEGLHEFKLLLEKGCYHILQPDAIQSADLFETVKIAEMAQVHGKIFMSHTFGNGVG